MSKRLKQDVEVQTILQVRPFILDYPKVGRVISNKKSNTEVSIKPIEDAKKFYTLLQYTPYQDIRKDSIKILELPRLTKLTFVSTPLTVKFNQLCKNAYKLTLCDDDAISELSSELIKRNNEAASEVASVTNSTQTDIMERREITEELPDIL